MYSQQPKLSKCCCEYMQGTVLCLDCDSNLLESIQLDTYQGNKTTFPMTTQVELALNTTFSDIKESNMERMAVDIEECLVKFSHGKSRKKNGKTNNNKH